MLLSNGARVNAKDSKWITPLHRACSIGSNDTVAVLLSYQADVNARDRLWQTPLHIAAANGAYDCLAQLLDHVPNPNVTDRYVIKCCVSLYIFKLISTTTYIKFVW